MNPTCSEPLIWTCRACAHSFKEQEWREAGRECPACGQRTGEWRCSLCQKEFQQPFLGREHPCSKAGFAEPARRPDPKPAWQPRKAGILIAAVVGLTVALILVVFRGGRDQKTEISRAPSEKCSAASGPAPRAAVGSGTKETAEGAFLLIKWSPLRDYRTISDEEAASNYFFLLWSSSSTNPADKVSAEYIGLIGDTPFSARIRKLLQSLDSSRPPGIPDWYPNKLVSIGSIASITGNTSEIFNNPGGTLGICKAIGTFADKSKMTCVRDFDGKTTGSYQIGLLNPIQLQVDMMNFPADNVEVPTGEIVSLTIPFR